MSEYIERNGLVISDTLPSDLAFSQNPKLYYQVRGYDRLYYRLDKRGDSIGIADTDTVSIEPVRMGDNVSMRYKQYTLTVPADTADYWTTLNSAYPTMFRYRVDNNICTAWHVAVGLMKYSKSECTILVPSKFGDQMAQNSVTAYGYRLNMLIR